MKTNYVLGFLFNEKRTKVALIRKERPNWQKGFLNGIGGHIESGELPHEAMIREFKEETGFEFQDWKHFCYMDNHDWTVDCYRGFSPFLFKLKSTTDEKIEIIDISSIDSLISQKTISNLPWLIMLALDSSDIKSYNVSGKIFYEASNEK